MLSSSWPRRTPKRCSRRSCSRTQHFEFRLLDGDLLTDLLSGINQDAGLGLTPEAVELAVRRGRGSARDAESALEQLAAAGGGEDDGSPLVELVDALADRDVSRTLQAVASAIAAGREPRRLGSDLVEHLRNAFLAVQAPSLVLMPGAVTAKLAETANQMGLPFLVRSMEVVGQAMVDMRDAVDPRVTLEVALIRLASPAASTSLTELLERVERLERATSEKGPAVPTPGAAASPPPPTTRAAPVEPGAAAAQRVGQPAQDHQAAGPAQARVALGAYIRGGSPSASPASAIPPTAIPLSASPRSGSPQSGSPSSASPQSGSPSSASPQSGSPSSASPSSASPPPSAMSAASDAHASSLPSRDELTKVWGDALLDKLSRPRRCTWLVAGS